MPYAGALVALDEAYAYQMHGNIEPAGKQPHGTAKSPGKRGANPDRTENHKA